jgi:glucose/mannose-6-phosphate isomerase
MIDLDDASALREADRSGMLATVAALGEHVRTSYEVGRGVPRVPGLDGVSAVVFCGMGGSAVAGDVLKQTFRDRLGVPVDVNRSGLLPAFAGPGTLVVVSSYSGNTSETLSAYREAVERGCRVLAITSGGELERSCAERGLPVVPVPGGGQPRAALGHLTFAMLGALETAGLLPRLDAEVDATVTALERAAAAMGPEVPTSANEAKRLADWIADRVPVVWGAEGIAAVAAMRWKTQLNENGKVPAWHAAMSELDHNEIVGWLEPFGAGHALVTLRHDDEDDEIAARFPLSVDIVASAGLEMREVAVRGEPRLATLFSLVAVGDFTSCYVGLRRGEDPTPVAAIEGLKAALAGREAG